MKNTKKKATKARAAVKRPNATAKVATGVRAKAARRTSEGRVAQPSGIFSIDIFSPLNNTIPVRHLRGTDFLHFSGVFALPGGRSSRLWRVGDLSSLSFLVPHKLIHHQETLIPF